MQRSQSYHNITHQSPNLPNLVSLKKASLFRNRSMDPPPPRQKKNLQILKSLKITNEGCSDNEDEDKQIERALLNTPQKVKTERKLKLPSISPEKKYLQAERLLQQTLVGDTAIQKFYLKYKNLDKEKEKEDFLNEKNIITQIAHLLDGYGFAPRRLDLIKLKGPHSILDLKSLGLGHSSMGSVVSQIIGVVGRFQFVDLSSNEIDRNISDTLISELQNVRIIDLSHNRIGKLGCDRFNWMLRNTKACLRELFLADNAILDNSGCVLINGLCSYGQLRVLNLNKNSLGRRTALQLKQYLQKDSSLQQLYLNWNEFNDSSAKQIFEGIKRNSELKVLDFSWNSIGFGATKTLSKIFEQNRSLLHIDISFCDIDYENSLKLSQSLQKNNTIYGIHYEGNNGYIDNNGFLCLHQNKGNNKYPLSLTKQLRKIDSVHSNPYSNVYNVGDFKDVCWICDGLCEISFVVSVDGNNKKRIDRDEIKTNGSYGHQLSLDKILAKSENKGQDQNSDIQCFIHFEVQNFKAIKMQCSPTVYTLNKMVMKGTCRYFYTFYKQGNRVHFITKDSQIEQYQKQIQVQIGTVKVKLYIQEVNCHVVSNTQEVVLEDYSINVSCFPRRSYKAIEFKQIKLVKVKKVVEREEKLKRKYRQLNKSLFDEFISNSNNRDENKNYLLRCLEFDIQNSKINKILTNAQDLEKLKEIVLSFYCCFKDTFYFLCAGNISINGVFFITETIFKQFVEDQKYVTKLLSLPKIMLKMYSCLSSAEINPQSLLQQNAQNNRKYSQIRLLSRPQFLQFFLRLAKQRVEEKASCMISKKIMKGSSQMLQQLSRIMKSLIFYSSRNKSQAWRKERLFKIDVFTVVKNYEYYLMDLYEHAIKLRQNKSRDLARLLTLDEIKEIFIHASIKRTKQGLNQINSIFLSSKMLQVEDGIEEYGLNFNEFIEFLLRFSQMVLFLPYSEKDNPIWKNEANCKHLPLFLRFEGLIINLYWRLGIGKNRRMDKMCENGIFVEETQILIEKIKGFGKNEEKREIGLEELIDELKRKYENRTVKIRQIVEQQIEVLE